MAADQHFGLSASFAVEDCSVAATRSAAFSFAAEYFEEPNRLVDGTGFHFEQAALGS